MRSVQISDPASDDTTRAEHVIGVDESGEISGDDPFALVAVRCRRSHGERLAELLVDHGLAPWRGKWQTLGKREGPRERDRRIEALIESLQEEEITWQGAVGYRGSIDHKAAAVCMLGKKTITSSDSSHGDYLLIPDGETNMYGEKQKIMRIQGAQVFDGGFQSSFGSMYITGLPKADLTYPEVTAADYLAGYIRKKIYNGESVESLPDEVVRFKHEWREPEVTPLPFFKIRGVSGEFGAVEQTRVAAWIKGRHPQGDCYDVSSQWENTVDMLESEELQDYLLDELEP